MISFLFSLLSIVLILLFLWIVIPSLTGLPWIPAHTQRITLALELAQVKPGDIFYDLGSGDGRALIIAARDYGAHAIGIEISPIHCIYSWINVFFHKQYGNVEIKWASFYSANFDNADVIFTYITHREASRLKTRLEHLLKPGVRVVTVSCEVEGWRSQEFNREELLYLYIIPQCYHEKGVTRLLNEVINSNSEANGNNYPS